MAVNKNFVVKNGLEVNTNLIVADTDAQKVGIGTTISRYLLHVNEGTGIGASSVYVTGISTVAQEFNVGLGGSIFTVLGNAEGTAGIGQSVGVGTAEPAYLLDVRSPVSTGQTALYVQGDMRVTGDINLDDIRLDQLQVSGVSTFIGLSTFASGITVLGLGATTTTLNVSGVSTFSDDILIGTGATVGFGSTAYFRDNAKVILGDSEDLQIYHDGSTSFIKDVGTGILAITSNGGHIALMNSAQTENMAKFVVDGAVELYHNGAIKLETTSSGVDVTGTFNSTGITTLASGGGITTTGGDLYVGGDLFVTDNITLDTNLNILGIATIGTLAVTGVGTAALFGGYAALSAPASAETKNFAVTVAAKTSNNRYSGGSSNAYYIDGVEAPFLTLTPGRTYRFTLSSSDMSNHPFRFYLEADKSTSYTTDVTTAATYTEIKVTDTTPTVLHYQCSSHGYMGNSIQTNSNTIVVSAASTFSGVIDSNNATQSSSSTTGSIIASGGVGIAKNLYVGGGAEVTGITTITGTLDANGALDVDGHTELDDVNVAGFSTFVSNVIIGTGATVGFGTSAFFGDNKKAIFGAGDDLEIYHNANNSHVDSKTGDLYIKNLATDADVIIQTDDGSGGETDYIICDGSSGEVKLHHYGTEKFNTTAEGIEVTGHSELDNVNVAGFSTFVGFATFSDYVFVQDGLNVAGVVTATSFDGLGQIGVGSEGTFIGVGITMVDFKSSNEGNTVDVDGTSGIATVTVQTGVSLGLAIALGG